METHDPTARLRRALDASAATTAPSPREFATVFAARATPATWVLLAANALFFGLEALWGGTESIVTLARMGALIPSRVRAGEGWRLLASTLLHVGPLHVGLNCLMLYSLGRFVEKLLGSRRFVLLYGLAGLGGALATLARSANPLVVGASGCLWGLLTASASLAWRPAGLLPHAALPGLRRAALINLAIAGAVSFVPGVEIWAHAGGGAVGAALVLTGLLPRGLAAARAGTPASRHGGRLLTLATVLVAGALAASALLALAHGRAWAIAREMRVWTRHALPGTGYSVELPSAVAAPRAEAREGATREFAFDDPYTLPVEIRVLLAPLDRPLTTPAEFHAQYAAEREAAIDFDPGRDATVLGGPREQVLGGFPLIERRWRDGAGGIHLRGMQLRREDVVVAECHGQGNACERFGATPARVLGSLRATAR